MKVFPLERNPAAVRWRSGREEEEEEEEEVSGFVSRAWKK